MRRGAPWAGRVREVKGTKDVCANVDLFSGLIYRMLGISEDLFTPLFACARMSGWAAHRFEEIVSGKRIIRPAYKSIRSGKRDYVPMSGTLGAGRPSARVACSRGACAAGCRIVRHCAANECFT